MFSQLLTYIALNEIIWKAVLGGMLKEAVMACFKILFHHVAQRTQENNENLQGN
jgi:hypothetical protein